MGKDCPHCAEWRGTGASFCPVCGKDLTEKDDSRHPFCHTVALIATLVAIAVVIIDLIFCTVNFGAISESLSHLVGSVYLTWGVGEFVLFYVYGSDLSYLLALDMFIIAACLLFGCIKLLHAAKREIAEEDENITEKTGMTAAATGLCVSIFIAVAYFMIASMFGHTANTEWMSKFTIEQMAFLYTRAGVQEEVICRVVWIGIPMMVVALIMRKDRNCWQHLFGGFGMSKTALVLIVFSSCLFGLAHLNGWGWTKVPDAIIAGLIFGYLYAQYGLYASILAHAANDTLSAVAWIGFGPAVQSILILFLLGAGLVMCIYWLIKPNRALLDIRNMKTFPEKIETGFIDRLKRH